MHTALLAVVIEEMLQRLAHRIHADTAEAGHHLSDGQQVFALQAAQHAGSRLLAHAEQHDGSLLDQIQTFRALAPATPRLPRLQR
jgi:hypothetical protein